MNPEWLKTFVTFAETPSLEIAAKELGTTQPTLTRQLKALEDSAGVTLFSMQGRRKVLTQIGQALLQELKPRFQGLDDVVEKALRFGNSPERMKIRIGARREILLSVVPELKFPGHLILEFCGHTEIIERLLRRTLDVGITHQAPDSLHIGATLLFRDEFKLCYPRTWRIEKQSLKKTLAYLSQSRPLLSYDEKFSQARKLLEKLDIANPLLPSRTCADWGLIVNIISMGNGWSIVPERQIRFEKNLEVIDISRDVQSPVEFYWIYLKELAKLEWFKKLLLSAKHK